MRGAAQPIDLEAESHVIAVALRHGVIAALGAADFGHPANRATWEAIQAVAGAGDTHPLVAVAAELRCNDELRLLRAVGGLEHLVKLFCDGGEMVSESIEYWARRVREAARRRRLALLATQLLEAAKRRSGDELAHTLDELRAVAAW